jgi:hypothetical protein
VAEHNRLLTIDRSGLSTTAVELIERLAQLSAEDYEWAAALAVQEIVPWIGVYAEPEQIAECLARGVPIDEG